MNRTDYDAYTSQLVANLSDDERVVGLVAVGSMAAVGKQPDEWSDHDFWVVAREGSAAEVRDDRGWLPQGSEIVVWFAESDHGRSVIYADGHLVEYAVFGPDEVDVTSANEYRVLIDRYGLETKMAEVEARTRDRHPHRADDLFGSFLAQLTIGITRHARGERLSANHLVRGWAARTLAELIARVVPPQQEGSTDNLDPNRRFETTYPGLGAEILAALDSPLLDCASTLVDLAERELTGRLDTATPAGFTALRTTLARARSAG